MTKLIPNSLVMKKYYSLLLFSISVITFLGLWVGPVQAFTFAKNNLLSDADFTTNTLSRSGIEQFLSKHNSVLSNYTVTDTDGVARLVSSVIYRAATTYNINAAVLLVLTEKESSGITSPSFTSAISDWTLGYGVCDSCTAEDAAAYKGIANQYTSAARGFRRYLNDLETTGSTISGWRVGATKITSDGIAVTPENKATAALYTYNPWVGAYGGGDSRWGANSLFVKLWQNWFALSGRIQYPNGTVFQVNGKKGIYLIQDNTIRKFSSKSVFLTNYQLQDIVMVAADVANDQLRYYDKGASINFPNYAVVRNRVTGDHYFIIDGKKRKFGKGVFKQYGFFKEEIIKADPKDLRMPDGAPIDMYMQYPGGAVIRNKQTGQIYYVDPEKQKKHPIFDPAILHNRFPNLTILPAGKKTIRGLERGAAVKLRDGSLVKTADSGDIWLIDRGQKRKISSPTVFQKYGYSWDAVQEISTAVLHMHKTGDPLNLKKKSTTTTATTNSTALSATTHTTDPVTTPTTRSITTTPTAVATPSPTVTIAPLEQQSTTSSPEHTVSVLRQLKK
jgi:hypothetical protein